MIKVLLLLLSCSIVFAQVRYDLPCNKQLLVVSGLVAQAQVGTKEATGHNDGEQVENYLKSVGLNPKGKYPYCAAGQYYCFKEATDILGLPASDIPIKKTGLANGIYDDAKIHGHKVTYIASINTFIVWKNKNSASGHIERIVKVYEGGWVLVVGFNTSNGLKGSQAEGNGVFYVLRNIYHPLSRILGVRGLVGFYYG